MGLVKIKKNGITTFLFGTFYLTKYFSGCVACTKMSWYSDLRVKKNVLVNVRLMVIKDDNLNERGAILALMWRSSVNKLR
jgi:hypothetical protein